MKIYKHLTSMSKSQRFELIRILLFSHDIKYLATLNDVDLHSLWLDDCEYENPYKVKNKLKQDK